MTFFFIFFFYLEKSLPSHAISTFFILFFTFCGWSVAMQLSVHVIEARGLRALDPDELSKPYARLQLGKHRLKTQVIKKTINPVWEEEFCFWVGNLHPRKKLTVSVLDDDDDKLLGQSEVPLQDILDSDNLSLGNAWYELKPKRKSSKNRVCGNRSYLIYFYISWSTSLVGVLIIVFILLYFTKYYLWSFSRLAFSLRFELVFEAPLLPSSSPQVN